uniref:Uncharacterized protein n=1 Tax=Trypanosoma congolense (strain IL3000) TaxID=1068625 RepID=G0URI4_TRYCI|nr:conserved hypothetical protein [Trypanosoma congolense IL3000]
MPCSVTPEQELQVIQTILRLRMLGSEESGERLRIKVRQTLLESVDDEAAVGAVEALLRRYGKEVKKLDGSYERERELKRLRTERGALQGSRFVDDEAESGEDDESDNGEENEEIDGRSSHNTQTLQ